MDDRGGGVCAAAFGQLFTLLRNRFAAAVVPPVSPVTTHSISLLRFAACGLVRPVTQRRIELPTLDELLATAGAPCPADRSRGVATNRVRHPAWRSDLFASVVA